MKQVAQNYKSGELAVLDVPVPACKPGGVLVRSLYSLISTGTEMMKVSEARMSLVGKARARPDQVRKLLDSVAQQGASGDIPEGDEPAGQLHPARLFAVRRRGRGRRGRRAVLRRSGGRGGRQRVRSARRGELDTHQPVRSRCRMVLRQSMLHSRRSGRLRCRVSGALRSPLARRRV